MIEMLKWSVSKSAPGEAQVAGYALIIFLYCGILTVTYFAAKSESPIFVAVVMACWIGIPAWVIRRAYSKRRQ